MADPVEHWKQEKIEQLAPGESWNAEKPFAVHRYKEGWYFYWKFVGRSAVPCLDLGRFFDEDHIWEMRKFMAGDWTKGILIWGPKPEELV